MESLRHITIETIIITVFVFVAMVIIDYINVVTHGRMSLLIKGRRLRQYIFGALFGLIPACLGLFLVVGFYVRGLVTFGALFATMVATAGDEGLFMFLLFPRETIVLLSITFVIAVISGFFVDRLIPILKITTCKECELSSIHSEDEQFHYFKLAEIKGILRDMTLARFLLLLLLGGSSLSIVFQIFAGSQEVATKIILVIVNLIATFIIVTVPEHYLHKHIWEHIAKRHLIRIFLITYAVLFSIEILNKLIDLKTLVSEHQNLIYLSAILIGLIPGSGPHLIFVMMYAKGIIPFKVLLINTIMQDGHGLLPLIPHSLRDAIYIKLFKLGIVVLMLFSVWALRL